MKSIPWFSPARLLAIGIVLILVASWSGHQLGKASGRALAEEIVPRRATRGTGEFAEKPADNLSPPRKPELAASRNRATEKRLLELYQNDDGASLDPEILAETKRLLATMSSEEIAAFLKKQMIFDGGPGPVTMHFNIAALWAAQDPVAALAYLRNSPQIIDQQLAASVFQSWIAEDPEKAMAWLKEGNPSSVRPDDLKSIFAGAIGELAKRDPDLALREISNLPPEFLAQSMNGMSWEMGADPRYRDQILAMAGSCEDPEIMLEVQNNIVRQMAEIDPASALKFLESLEISEPQRLKLDAAIVFGQIDIAPAAAFDGWMDRNATLAEIPPAIKSAVSTWLYSKQDEAIAWLDQLPPGERRDAFVDSGVSSLTNHRHFPEAAGLAEAIESTPLRETALQKVHLRWSLDMPEQAAAWKAGLPVADRAMLEKQ